MGYISKTAEKKQGLKQKGADRPFFMCFIGFGLLPPLLYLLDKPFLKIIFGLDEQKGLSCRDDAGHFFEKGSIELIPFFLKGEVFIHEVLHLLVGHVLEIPEPAPDLIPLPRPQGFNSGLVFVVHRPEYGCFIAAQAEALCDKSDLQGLYLVHARSGLRKANAAHQDKGQCE